MHNICADKTKEWAQRVTEEEKVYGDIELSVNTRKITACTFWRA